MFTADSANVIIITCILYALFILYKFARFLDNLTKRVDSLEEREDLSEEEDDFDPQVSPSSSSSSSSSELSDEDKEKVERIIALSEESIKTYMERYEKILDTVEYIEGTFQGEEKKKRLRERKEMLEQEEVCIRMRHAFITAFLPNVQYQLQTILPLRLKYATRYSHVDYLSGSRKDSFYTEAEKVMF